MRVLMRSSLAGGLAGLALCLVLPLAGCFEYDEPDCSFKCGTDTSAPLCPDDYECRSDGYCHLHDSTTVCPYSDASIVADQSVVLDMPDAAPPPDGATDL
jgi:hypothetical protein